MNYPVIQTICDHLFSVVQSTRLMEGDIVVRYTEKKDPGTGLMVRDRLVLDNLTLPQCPLPEALKNITKRRIRIRKDRFW